MHACRSAGRGSGLSAARSARQIYFKIKRDTAMCTDPKRHASPLLWSCFMKAKESWAALRESWCALKDSCIRANSRCIICNCVWSPKTFVSKFSSDIPVNKGRTNILKGQAPSRSMVLGKVLKLYSSCDGKRCKVESRHNEKHKVLLTASKHTASRIND
eukprot:SAG22_NODE_1384_length_4534_cov_2.266516_2_plen_159_part_00